MTLLWYEVPSRNDTSLIQSFIWMGLIIYIWIPSEAVIWLFSLKFVLKKMDRHAEDVVSPYMK